MERNKMSYCTTLRVSWKWNYGALKLFELGILCTAHAQRDFFIFDRLYLMTYVSSEDGKGIIFFQF